MILYEYRINFTSAETRILVLPDAEDRTIVSPFFWTKHRNVTDEQTDRQIYRGYYSGLHCEQCGLAIKAWLVGYFSSGDRV